MLRQRKVESNDHAEPADDHGTSNTRESRPRTRRTARSSNRLLNCLWSGFLCFLTIVALLCAFLLTFYALIDGPINAVYFSLPDPPAWNGPLEQNDLLTKTERLFDKRIQGPESQALRNGKLYTSTMDGQILELDPDTQAILREFRLRDKPSITCNGSYDSFPVCGRPLGIRFAKDEDTTLIVIDAYFGIYEVDISTGSSSLLLPTGSRVSDGPPLNYPNDFDVTDDGVIIFSESSTKWDDRRHLYSVLENSGDGRYYLHGAKRGTFDVFADNIPGYPDNIRLARNGSLWVPIAAVRTADDNLLAQMPKLRTLLTKLIPVTSLPWFFEKITAPYGLVLLLNQKGEVEASLHDVAGTTVPYTTQVTEAEDGQLYLGSDAGYFIGRLKR
uniref:Adipocyte plasma membrane-associated protein n=1 Tax=Plectus sambesii TaxID=2011161 RepID=A0A914X8H6_9BILA